MGMDWINDSIVEWYDIARKEHVSQKGMNYGINPNYSIILMSRRDNVPYNDCIYPDGITIEYGGHDAPKNFALKINVRDNFKRKVTESIPLLLF
jgi:hypothetical protein